MTRELAVTQKQKAFIDAEESEVLFGGAAGGGKSYGQMVADEVPSVARVLLPYCRRGLCAVHVFSTVVHPASARDLAARKFVSTGGTDIDCVLRHVLDLPARKRPRAVVVVTDGYTGCPDAALAAGFRAAGMRLYVGLVKSDPQYNPESNLSSIAEKFIKLF